MGSTLDRGTNNNYHKLGDGIQEVVSRFQNPNIFWFLEGKEDETSWMEQRQFFPCVYHILQTSDSRSLCLQKKEVVLYDS